MTEDEESYAKASSTPGDCELKNEIGKVLGLKWDTASDEFFSSILPICTIMAALSGNRAFSSQIDS